MPGIWETVKMEGIKLLKDQIIAVARARQAVALLRDAKRQSLSEWEVANNSLLATLKTAEMFCAESEAILRGLILAEYAATGDKAPAPGVGIRLITKLTYVEEDAFAWAVEHKVALKLNTGVFEKMAKVSFLPFVLISQEPQATIASELKEE